MLIRLIQTEFKKYYYAIPYSVIGAVVLILIIGTAAFCASDLLYQENSFSQSTVAIVTDDPENPYITFALDFLSEMESTSISLSFEIMDESTAYRRLEQGNVIAVLLFPHDVINGILYGDNYPIEVVFPKDNNLSAVFLTEITKAGGTMLAGAQTGIYTTGELYSRFGCANYLSNAYERVNMQNFNHVLRREIVFETIAADISGAPTLGDYYLASGITFFLLLVGILFAGILSADNKAYRTKLLSEGISGLSYLLAKTVTLFVVLFIFLLLIGITADIFFESVSLFQPETILFLLILALFLALYINFFYLLSKHIASSVMLLFLTGCVQMFLSGGLIPLAFFPDFLRNYADFMPAAYIQQGILSMIAKDAAYPFLSLLVMSFILFIFDLLTLKRIYENN